MSKSHFGSTTPKRKAAKVISPFMARIADIGAKFIIENGTPYGMHIAISKATNLPIKRIAYILTRTGYSLKNRDAWVKDITASTVGEPDTTATPPAPKFDNQLAIVSAFQSLEHGLLKAAKNGILVAAHNLTKGQSVVDTVKFLNDMYSKLTYLSEVTAATPESAPHIFE